MATTRIVTLNEVLNKFKSFVDNHAQLRDFGYGPTSEIGKSRQMQFPYMWVTHQTDSYIKVLNKTNLPELKFVLLFMDQVNDQENVQNAPGENSDNGQEVMSDTLQYLQDIVMQIQKDWGTDGMILIEDVRTFPAFDETVDKVNGWAGEITLKLTYVNCNTPQ